MGLFLDIEAISEAQSNAGIEYFYKSVHDHEDEIWALHPSPFIRRLVEVFSQRGLLRLESFRSELVAWLSGQRHTHAGVTMPRPDGAMERWGEAEIGIVKLYLETLPPERWDIDTHMLMVDYLAQRYLPQSDMRSEGEWLATRAVLMGKVQANMERISDQDADDVLAALPLTAAAAKGAFDLPAMQAAVLDFARTRVVENVVALADDARHKMRRVVARHVEAKALGKPEPHSLETRLGDEFGELNRDWRRIAVTEAGEATNAGYIASLAPGRRVKRVEQYRNCCAFCASIDGRIVTVVAADAPDKDGDTQIWPGKDNIGRSQAPRKRVGGLLVEREPDEMWWLPAGLVHPHCRGRWVPVIEDQPGDDKEFGDYLRSVLGKKHGPDGQ